MRLTASHTRFDQEESSTMGPDVMAKQQSFSCELRLQGLQICVVRIHKSVPCTVDLVKMATGRDLKLW